MVEITIPMEKAEAENVVAMCDALGLSVEAFLSNAVKRAVSVLQSRYDVHQQLTAAGRQAEGVGVCMVDPETKLPVDLRKKQ